jgi:hypothetical protein
MPIQVISQAELKSHIFQADIERICRGVSEVLYADDLEAQDLMSYCLREIVRNTFEHGDTDECIIMAQRWKNNTVELAVVDRGRGVYESLKARYELRDNRSALLHAIQPGVSGSDLDIPMGEWGNSGFGLFTVAELGRSYGEFLLCSHGDTLSVGPQGEQYGQLYFYGTSIRLFVSVRDAEYFPNFLRQIVEKGEQIAKDRTGLEHKASTKSMHS